MVIFMIASEWEVGIDPYCIIGRIAFGIYFCKQIQKSLGCCQA